MSTYFLLDPFEFPYYFYRFRGELIYVLSIVACIPSTFCPTLGHHQWRIYYKSDVTFVLAYYYSVKASLPLKIMAFAFKCNSINVILHTTKPNNGILASLDVENLFTNVPVNETIDIIINNIYNNPSLPPLKINPNILRKLLLTCTTEVPFYGHLGNIYVQTDGVSMGSVLGPIFSNFYMSDLENRIFNSIKNLQYTKDMLMISLFLLIILTKSTYYKTPSKTIQFLKLLMN